MRQYSTILWGLCRQSLLTWEAAAIHATPTTVTGSLALKPTKLAKVSQQRIGLESIPLEDSSIDAVTAFDFLEHLPRAIWKDGTLENTFINTMNDV